MSYRALSEHHKFVVLGTVAGKITKIALGIFVVYLVYRAGLEGLAYAMLFGGGGYALVQAINDLKNGRKPWLPIERVPAEDYPDQYMRSAMVGFFLGKVGAVLFGVYLAYILYQAGLTTLTYGLVFGGGGYAVVKTISDWRDGIKPWYPTKRVQKFE